MRVAAFSVGVLFVPMAVSAESLEKSMSTDSSANSAVPPRRSPTKHTKMNSRFMHYSFRCWSLPEATSPIIAMGSPLSNLFVLREPRRLSVDEENHLMQAREVEPQRPLQDSEGRLSLERNLGVCKEHQGR